MENLWVAAVVLAAVALAGMGAMAVRFRGRSARQWRTSLDVYAEREIARRRREQTRQRARAFFTLIGAPVGVGSATPRKRVRREQRV